MESRQLWFLKRIFNKISYLFWGERFSHRGLNLMGLVLLSFLFILGISVFHSERAVSIEAELSQQSRLTCSLSDLPSQPQYDPNPLTLGNKQRDNSQEKREYYNRTEKLIDFSNAIQESCKAFNSYRKAAKNQDFEISAKLNEVSLFIEVIEWLKKTDKRLILEPWIPNIELEKDWVKQVKIEWHTFLKNELSNSIALQKKIESLPKEKTVGVYSQLNFARSITRLTSLQWSEPLPSFLPPNVRVDELFEKAVVRASFLLEKVNDEGASQDKVDILRAGSYAFGYYGQWHLEQNDFFEAQRNTEKALRLADSIQAPEIAYLWEWQLGKIYLAQQKTESAIQAYETAYKTVQSVRNELLSAQSDVQFSFRDRVEPLYRDYVSLLLKNKNNEQNNLLKAREIILGLQLSELQNLLGCSLEELGGDRLEPVESVIQNYPTAGVIYPIILDDRLDVILSLPGQSLVRVSTSNSQKEVVELTLKKLRYSLEQPFFSNRGKEASKQVYQWLIEPLEEKLQQNGIETLIFVLDGALRNIPMAALYDGKKYLIEKYAIALSLGLEFPEAEPSRQWKALLAAFSGQPNDREFSPLESAGKEVESIHAIFSKSHLDSSILSNDNFTPDNLKTAIESSGYNLLHLATHGQFDFTQEKTFIFAGDGKKVTLSGLKNFLTFNSKNPIELIVFSACETATGDNRSVLGIAGMAFHSGARSTLATLWSIETPSNTELMSLFYKKLTSNNMTKAKALQLAQLELLKNYFAYKPLHWSAHVLVGDWR